MIEFKGKYTTAKVMIDEFDGETRKQIESFINNESFNNPIAIMPDCHAGKGSCIGFTMEIGDRIIPNIVGVDISCGMRYVLLDKTVFNANSRKTIENEIRKFVPFGSDVHEVMYHDVESLFDWTGLNVELGLFTENFNKRYGTDFSTDRYSEKWFQNKCRQIGADYDRVLRSIGSVGSGNHFVEFGRDEKGNYTLTVHTGSRNFGKCIAEYWQNVAEMECNKPKQSKDEYIKFVKSNYPKIKWNQKIAEYGRFYNKKSSGLEYLQGENMFLYMVDVLFAQEYARVNRKTIIDIILGIIGKTPVEEIETAHNFIGFRDWIIRKGSISSHEGELQIIPMNMRDGLLVCEGKGNAEWNYSAPHGAGRVLSRSKAKEVLNQKEEEDSMKGIYTTCVPIDEAPSAYKDSKIIEAAIEPTCRILKRIKPVMNIKSK